MNVTDDRQTTDGFAKLR